MYIYTYIYIYIYDSECIYIYIYTHIDAVAIVTKGASAACIRRTLACVQPGMVVVSDLIILTLCERSCVSRFAFNRFDVK